MAQLTKIKEALVDICEDIVDLPREIKWTATRAYRRTLKLIDFIKLGWNDEDYDNGFISEVIAYKLESMEKYFTKHGHAEDSLLRAKQMRVARKALRQWERYDFGNVYMKRHMPFQYSIKFKKQEEANGLSRLITVYKNTDVELSKEDEEIYNKTMLNSLKFERRMKKRYKRIFFKLMYDNYLHWWD